MHPILRKLEGGDRRSIGRSNETVAEVLDDPGLFGTVFAGMLADDPLVRMRCADAVEKITARHPEYLHPHKTRLIREVARISQKEVRWHVAQMFSRLELTRAEQRQVLAILSDYLNDRSSIVRTFAMQSLADLAAHDRTLLPQILPHLKELTLTGTPAMRSRGKKLLAKLGAMPTRHPR